MVQSVSPYSGAGDGYSPGDSSAAPFMSMMFGGDRDGDTFEQRLTRWEDRQQELAEAPTTTSGKAWALFKSPFVWMYNLCFGESNSHVDGYPGGSEILQKVGILSGNMRDETLPPMKGPNPFLALGDVSLAV